MAYRSVLKWLHWLSAGLILYFFLVEPENNRTDPGSALSTHAGMGMLLGLVVLVWTLVYLRKGLAGRAGPKLPPLAKRAHPVMHRALHIGMPVMMLTGLAAGLAAPFLIEAFGLLPLNFANGTKSIHELAQEIHEIAFNALLAGIVAHSLFHIWRHVWIKDGALRIMSPKMLHKWL